MQAWRAGAQQRLALFGGVGDAEFGASFVVVRMLFQVRHQLRRQRRAAQRGESFYLMGAQDRNDAGANGNRHAALGQVVAEAEKVVVAEEKLCQDEICAAIDLGLQPVPIDFAAFLAGDMPFRKSGGADAETAHFLDEPDQLIGKLKTPFGFFEVSDSAAGGIPPQREDVFDAQTLRFQQDLAQFLRRRSDAGQMRHGG